jgi:hypothetical protein
MVHQATSLSVNSAKSRASAAAIETTKSLACAHFLRAVGTYHSVQVLPCHSEATTSQGGAIDLFLSIAR